MRSKPFFVISLLHNAARTAVGKMCRGRTGQRSWFTTKTALLHDGATPAFLCLTRQLGQTITLAFWPYAAKAR
ncbi:hypothetical protein KCP74_21390 [Salmonella enterica subsp. enterica]|nr:hypothetical protein KCP74_21390 [Salmonella enterica subsp. enterica]